MPISWNGDAKYLSIDSTGGGESFDNRPAFYSLNLCKQTPQEVLKQENMQERMEKLEKLENMQERMEKLEKLAMKNFL